MSSISWVVAQLKAVMCSSATNEKLDKDRFRRDLGNGIESYTEVARRLGIMKEMPTVIQGGLH